MKARWPICLAFVLFATALARDAVDAWIDATELPVTLRETSVEVVARNGALLRAFPVHDGLIRLETRVDQTDPRFLAMLVRYEDKRFYDHPGVDGLALLRAAGQALWHGRPVSGGSTLTMQVARLLEDGSTGRWRGKVRQIRVALALERHITKDQILSLYLTHAPYGGPLEGTRAAAFAWFGKEPRRLTESEAALLIALPQSPEARRPDRAPVESLRARNRVIDRLHGVGLLTREQAATAKQASLPSARHTLPRLSPHLADQLRANEPGATTIATTIDARIQAAQERVARRAVRATPARVNVAMVVANHQNGEILAHVGSAGYAPQRQGFVDLTRAKRSPGSLLKPLVYALAFDRGLAHPETLIHDGPVRFGTYAPQNFDKRFRGDVAVRLALQHSLNIPVVKLTDAIGPNRLLAALKKGGAEPDLAGSAPGLAVALGGVGLTLMELTQSYATLAAGGQGLALTSRPGQRTPLPRVVSEVSAWQVGNILGGLAPPPGAPQNTLAYKTGTSYGHRDAWAIGFDGTHVIGVWMGRADGTPVPGAFGGDLASPVLFDAFAKLKPVPDRLRPPPAATLLLANQDLPQPLRRFGARYPQSATLGPELTFPPNGATLEIADDLPIKLRGGTPPFTILSNGRPVFTGIHDTEVFLPSPGLGFSTLTVIDSNGHATRANVELTGP